MSLALLEQWQNDEAPFSPEPSSPIGAASDAFFEDAAVASGSDGTSSSNGSEDESDSDSSMASMSGGGAVKTFASAQDASEEPYKACCQAGGVPNVKKGRKKWTVSVREPSGSL